MMNKTLSTFLDHLAERFTAILAGVVSSRVESLRAEAQAEQQSQLEDLARQYEADGKIAIARTLRQRAVNLTAVNLAGEGVDVMEAVSAEPLRLPRAKSQPHEESLENLPDFSAPPRPNRKSRRRGKAPAIAQLPVDSPGAES